MFRHRMKPAALEDLVDTLTLTQGRAAAMQSGLMAADIVAMPGWLRVFGDGYFHYLGTLPLLSFIHIPGGTSCLGFKVAPGRLPLLRFAQPYLAANRGGQELRYSIIGGLMARGLSGYIAFGQAPEGNRVRVWIEVLEFWPRLGLGPLYILTQVVLHRLVTVAYLQQIAAGHRTT